MTIKGKLTLLLGIILATALAAGSYLGWNSLGIYREVASIGRSLDVLALMSDVSSKLDKTEHLLIHHLLYNDPLTHADVFKRISNAQADLDRIVAIMAVQQQQNVTGEAEARQKIAALSGKIQDYSILIDRIIQLHAGGRIRSAEELLAGETEALFDDMISSDLTGLISGEIGEVGESYQDILLGLGALPFLSRDQTLRDITMARITSEYFFNIERLDFSMKRELREFIQHMAYGRAEDRTELLAAASDIDNRIKEIGSIIEHQRALGREGEENDAQTLRNIRKIHDAIKRTAHKSMILAESGRRSEALRFFEQKAGGDIDSLLYPLLAGVSSDARIEIDEGHQSLLRTVRRTVLIELTILACIVLVIIAVSVLMIRGILTSLTALKNGTEIIRGGDLEHRIEVTSSDELGDLSVSFNRMTETLRESNEELKSFAYIVSHDLRAPLVNIRGFAAELRYSYRDLSKPIASCLEGLDDAERAKLSLALEKDIPEALGFIDSSVARMDGLISAILKLSRMGRTALRQDRIKMNALVASLLTTVTHQIEERKTAVSVGKLPDVTADETSMGQIMGNLLDNAIKYLDPARPGTIEIFGEKTPEETIIHVRDNGHGIEKDDQKKIFEIFQRAGKQDVPGEGMGLAYVKTLVKRHGGRIWCESEPGSGSTFSFSIPARRQTDRSAPDPKE